jgi:single-strand DNA-binding protein
MSTVNKLFFSGRLCRDPEVNTTRNGKTVCNITLAQDTKYKDAEGQWVEGNTVFVDVAIWGKRGEAFARYHSKGDMTLIEGRLRLDTWEDEGRKRSKLKVDCLDWHFAQAKASDTAVSLPESREDDTPF